VSFLQDPDPQLHLLVNPKMGSPPAKSLPADDNSAIQRLIDNLDSAQRDPNSERCQELLGNAMIELQTDSTALDHTLFDIFGSIVRCADLSGPIESLVQAYLQLVLENCAGREVLTLLMSALDCSSG